MNYLAHLFLAGQSEDAKLGGLLGDFAKGNITGKYNAEVELEIQIHRKVDFYTDNHLIVKNAKELLGDSKRKYGNIILDVFYDHALAQNWEHYSEVNLKSFAEQMYLILQWNMDILPSKLNETAVVMSREDWLTSYREFSGFEMAIARISKRLRQGNTILECFTNVKSNYYPLLTSFDQFFPQLIDYIIYERSLLANI
jgi:acyl carrier protein phosphodiesterase